MDAHLRHQDSRTRIAMPTTRQNDMPAAECPHCHRPFAWDDYALIEVGDERECPFCEKTIHVIGVEYVIHADLGTEKPEK